MKKNNTSVSRILCCALLLSQLCACSSPIIIYDTPLSDAVTADETVPAVTETEAVTETAPITEAPVTETVPAETEALPDPLDLARDEFSKLRRDDLDGMNILIAAAYESAVFGDAFDGDNAGSTVLPVTRAERTRLVEERYNVRILNYVFEKEALFREIKNANLSDVPYVADFYALPYDQIGRFWANGLLLNLRTLPFTDFRESYFDRTAMNALSAGYGIWGAVGDYTFSPENAYAIYFNKDLNQTLELPEPYAQVNDGTWTWDALFAASKTARASLDGEGNATIWGDNLGTLGIEICEPLFTDAAALSIVSTGADRTPTVSSDTDRMTTVAELLRRGMQNASTAPASNDTKTFLDGNMLFYCGTLSHMSAWADEKTPWGIVPLPKTDAAQRTYNTYVGDSAVMCVASTNGALEATGTIMQALFASAAHTYPDIYIDEALRYYVRDSETVEMLDLICSSMRYDFTSMFASGFKNLGYASEYTIRSAVTQNYSVKSVYSNYRAAAEKELKAAFPTDR